MSLLADLNAAASAQVVVTYNSNLLSVDSVSNGSATGSWLPFNNTANAGTINIGMFGVVPVSGVQKEIAVIHFRVKNPAVGTTSNLTITQASLGSENLIPANITSGTFTLIITNQAPIAQAQSFSVDNNATKDLTLVATDGDAADHLIYSIVANPQHGTLSGTAPTVTYHPTPGYSGSDSFTFKANDATVDSNVATVGITVTVPNVPPVAAISANKISGFVPLIINFDASNSTDADGSIASYLWEFGDGTTSTSKVISHTFAAGTFTVTLTVTDNKGATGTSTATITATVNQTPAGTAQNISTSEDAAKSIVLVGTDAETPSPNLVFRVTVPPIHGALTGTAPNLTYTPAQNYNGSDSFQFVVNDGLLDSPATTVGLTITPVNDAPVANAKNVNVGKNASVAIILDGTDVDGDALSFPSADMTQPTHGTLTGTAPNFTYTPSLNYSGPDSFTFKVYDGTVKSPSATVAITVSSSGNSVPVANAQNLQIQEDAVTSITLTATDGDNDPLTYTITNQPTHGTLTGTAPNVTYTPAAEYSGSDSFLFKVSDGKVSSTAVVISIQVNAVNDPPIANSQNVATNEDAARGILLSGTDAEGASLTYILASSPTHGTLSGTMPNLTYTPSSNYNGTDSFTFKVNDGNSDSTPGTINISVLAVNDIPTGTDQSVTTAEDTAKAIILNGSDVESAVTFNVISGPSHGALSGTAPNLTYTPTANYNGTDGFTYKINDGAADSSVVNVAITVTAVNDAPTTSDQNITTAQATSKPITLTATDVDSASLTYTIVNQPSHGALTGTAPNFTYTPQNNYFGLDNFTFKVSDGELEANGTVLISVIRVNNIPKVDNQDLTGEEDKALSITLTGHDDDPADVLTFSIVAQPTKGTLSGSGVNLVYTPGPDANGADSFTFKANDGLSDSSTGKISISLAPVNDAPAAEGQNVAASEEVNKDIVLKATDVDHDALTYSIVSDPAHGQLVGSAPNLTYKPEAGYFGKDSFTFKVNDGSVDSNTATVNVEIAHVNHAPVAQQNDDVAVNEDESVDIVLGGTDTDKDDVLTYSIVRAPAHGTISGVAPNISYVPDYNYNGVDTFTFKVNDGKADSNVIEVKIVVNAVNDAPAAFAQDPDKEYDPSPNSAFPGLITTSQNIPVSIPLFAKDPDGDVLTYDVFLQPAHGQLSGTAPNLTYTPETDYFGNDEFKFLVSDGTSNSNEATITIKVKYVNKAPVASVQTITTSEDTQTSVTLQATDIEGDNLKYIIVGNPSKGTLSGSGASLTYTPKADLNGQDTFTFKANDGDKDSNVATVTVNITAVEDKPVANSLSVATEKNVTKSFTLLGTDADGDKLTYGVESQPGSGFLSGKAPNLTYTPRTDFSGTDTFTYSVSDGKSDSNTATVTIDVRKTNKAPVAKNKTASVNGKSSVDIALEATDEDGDTLSYTVVQQPKKGKLTGSGSTMTYLSSNNITETDSFTYKVNDGIADSNVATVTVNVSAVYSSSGGGISVISGSSGSTADSSNAQKENADSSTGNANTANQNETSQASSDSKNKKKNSKKPTAHGQTVSATEDQATAIKLTGVAQNGGTLTYKLVSVPQRGTLSGAAPDLLYTPYKDFSGSDIFAFKVNDGNVDSDSAIVNIQVTNANDAPVADNLKANTSVNTSVSVRLSAQDVDGDMLNFNVTSSPSHGTLSGQAPDLRYTPAKDYMGNDQFGFQVTDSSGASSTGTVSVNVGEQKSDEPLEIDFKGTVVTGEGESVVIPAKKLLAGLSSGRGGVFTITGLSTMLTKGKVKLLKNGDIAYDPGSKFDYLNKGQFALDRFVYEFKNAKNEAIHLRVAIKIKGLAGIAPNKNIGTEPASVSKQ